ncbi:helix-turn-helix domain-containing protein [Candidatus Bathyarchaeota archaeon]|nr:helix-turn-helix domain-containing protein [Candidatus Bathyarchaeota archaeon]
MNHTVYEYIEVAEIPSFVDPIYGPTEYPLTPSKVIVWLALKMGLFDYPKRIDTLELSRRLGVSPSTLSEIMRRGLRRLLEHYFKLDPTGNRRKIPSS